MSIINDELAFSVWQHKYAAPGETHPDEMHSRLADEIAKAEVKYIKNETGFFSNFKNPKLSTYGRHRQPLTYDRIFSLFKDFKYIVPQGSIMSMLGRKDKIGSLSNCFVVGQPEDSYGGIMFKDQELAQLMKRRGGVGLDISTLRPKQTLVTNAAGSSTGPVSFMDRYSNTTREVAQDGRRGALMLTIDCRHPDVADFVNIKQDRSKVTGANISVNLRDDFMKAVQNDEDYILRFPCNLDINHINHEQESRDINNWPYNELIELSIGYIKKIRARELYNQIVHNAWDNAEPGQMFVDRHWDYSPDSVYPQYKGVTTNPCGEIFMQPYDACRLLALNYSSFIVHPYTPQAYINYPKLYEMAYEQQRIADDIVDLEISHIDRIITKIMSDPESEEVKRNELEMWKKIKAVASAGRRTGCGFTALGDALAMLGLKYDSDEALAVIEELGRTKLRGELDCSIDLAILRGTFKGWNSDKEFIFRQELLAEGHNAFYDMLVKEFPDQALRMDKFGRRNISWSTVAPTGTVSLMTQTSSGLEPIFMPYYIRRRKINPNEENIRVDFTDQNGDNWMEYPVLHPEFKKWITTATDFDFQSKYQSIEHIPKDVLQSYFELSPWVGSTANDIDWLRRIEIQSVIQKYVSHSISSTINLPNNVTQEEVAKIYMYAWEKQLKGVTIYRDGCRSGVLVSDNSAQEEAWMPHDAPRRPDSLPVEIHSTISKGVKWNVFVGMYQDRPYEVFAIPYFTNESNLDLVKRKKGRYDLLKGQEVYSENITSEMNDEQEVITRLVSTSLRHGADITFIVEQLNKSHGDITSFSKAIARVLAKYVNVEKMVGRSVCEDCGSTNIIFEEGCSKCKQCGSSKCG